MALLFLLAVFVVGCDTKGLERYWSYSRFQLIKAGGSSENFVYRLDRETGQVCVYRWYKVDDGNGELLRWGFETVGCQK